MENCIVLSEDSPQLQSMEKHTYLRNSLETDGTELRVTDCQSLITPYKPPFVQEVCDCMGLPYRFFFSFYRVSWVWFWFVLYYFKSLRLSLGVFWLLCSVGWWDERDLLMSIWFKVDSRFFPFVFINFPKQGSNVYREINTTHMMMMVDGLITEYSWKSKQLIMHDGYSVTVMQTKPSRSKFNFYFSHLPGT